MQAISSTVTLPRVIDAETVEAILRRDDIRFYRRWRRGLIASRGTDGWSIELDDFRREAREVSRSEAYRALVSRHYHRLRSQLSPAELVRPDWDSILAQGVADGSVIV